MKTKNNKMKENSNNIFKNNLFKIKNKVFLKIIAFFIKLNFNGIINIFLINPYDKTKKPNFKNIRTNKLINQNNYPSKRNYEYVNSTLDFKRKTNSRKKGLIFLILFFSILIIGVYFLFMLMNNPPSVNNPIKNSTSSEKLYFNIVSTGRYAQVLKTNDHNGTMNTTINNKTNNVHYFNNFPHYVEKYYKLNNNVFSLSDIAVFKIKLSGLKYILEKNGYFYSFDFNLTVYSSDNHIINALSNNYKSVSQVFPLKQDHFFVFVKLPLSHVSLLLGKYYAIIRVHDNIAKRTYSKKVSFEIR